MARKQTSALPVASKMMSGRPTCLTRSAIVVFLVLIYVAP